MVFELWLLASSRPGFGISNARSLWLDSRPPNEIEFCDVRQFRLVVRRLFESPSACLAAFEHLNLALELAVARRERFDVALLAHYRLTELLQ